MVRFELKKGSKSAKKFSKMEKNLSETASDRGESPLPFAAAAKGLYYISETDAEIVPFSGEKAEAVTKEELLRQTLRTADEKIEEVTPDAFFAQLTHLQDWFDSARKERAAMFAELYDELESGLRDLHVFRIGQTRIDIYVVGLDADGRLAGIQTKAVET